MGTDGDGWEAPRSRGRLPLPLLAVLLFAGVALVAFLLSADDEGTELTVEDVDEDDDGWPAPCPPQTSSRASGYPSTRTCPPSRGRPR